MSPASLPVLLFLLLTVAALPSPWFLIPWLGAVFLVLVWIAHAYTDWRP